MAYESVPHISHGADEPVRRPSCCEESDFFLGGGYNGLIPNLFYFAASFGMAALSACPERVESLEAAV